MRYKLRTLLILLAILPPRLAFGRWKFAKAGASASSTPAGPEAGRSSVAGSAGNVASG